MSGEKTSGKVFDFEKLRIALMENYNSQTLTHAGYIIALTVGFLSIISRWTDLWLIGNLASVILWRIILLFIISTIVLLICYLSLRIVYWATMSDQVRVVTENDAAQINEGETLIIKIEYATVHKFENPAKFSLAKYLAKRMRKLGNWCFLIELGLALTIAIILEFLLRVHGI